MDCHFLPQGIFPTQRMNPSLLHCRQIVYRLSYKGSPEYFLILPPHRHGQPPPRTASTRVGHLIVTAGTHHHHPKSIVDTRVPSWCRTSYAFCPTYNDKHLPLFGTSLVAQGSRLHLSMQGTRVSSLGGADPLEKEMTTHSRILAWETPWTEEPGRLHTVHGVTKE